jgi:hypothetical protein
MPSAPLKAEMDLLIRSLRLRISRTETDRLPEVEGVNWAHALWLARQHRMLLLLGGALNRPAGMAPPDVLAQLNVFREANQLRGMQRARELCLLQDIFNRAGIPAISLSGWCLAQRYYERPELRELGETTTFFIHAKDRPGAEAELAKIGYTFHADPLKLNARERSHVLFQSEFGADGLHSQAVSDPIWYHTESFSVGGRTITTLKPEAWVLHLCWRGGINLWSDLRRIFDLAVVLQSPALDWPTVTALARELRFEAAFLLGLGVVREAFALPLPEIPASLLRRSPALARHASRLVRRITAGQIDAPGLFAIARTRVALQPNLPRKLRCIGRHVRAAIRYSAQMKPAPDGDLAYIGRYAPTPPNVVLAMLRLADAGPNDVVCDPGCGDGRVVIAAAQSFGARGLGIDIDPRRIAEAESAAQAAGVAGKVSIRCGDLLHTDLRTATIVCLYLQGFAYPAIRRKLQRELRPGSRIVSHDFIFPGWPPERTEIVRTTPTRISQIYLWRI